MTLDKLESLGVWEVGCSPGWDPWMWGLYQTWLPVTELSRIPDTGCTYRAGHLPAKVPHTSEVV